MKRIVSKFVAVFMVLAMVPTVALATEGAQLAVTSKTDKTVYEQGDTAQVTVEVKQSTEGAVAENIVFNERLVESENGMSISNLKVALNNEEQQVNVEMDGDGRGFIIATDISVASTDTLTLTYDVALAGATENTPIANRVHITADNLKEVTDYSVFSVGELPMGELNISKTASADTYEAGATAQYTVMVDQTTENAVVQDVVIKDSFTDRNVNINSESIKIMQDETDITKWADIEVLKDGDTNYGYTINTNTFITNQPITVTYSGTILGTGEINSTASAVGTGANETTTDNGITADNNPAFGIIKAQNANEFSTGDIAEYQIALQQTTEGQTARNVIVEDSIAKAEIDTGSITITKDGVEITQDCAISEFEDGVVIEIGDLAYGEEVLIGYEATVTATTGPIENTATVSADNAIAQSAKTVAGFTNSDGVTISKESSTETYAEGDEVDYEVTVSSDSDMNGFTINDRFSAKAKIKDMKVYEIHGEEATDISTYANAQYYEDGFGLTLNYYVERGVPVCIRYTATVGGEESYTNTATVDTGDSEATAENTIKLSRESGGSGDGPQTGDMLLGFVGFVAIIGAAYALKASKPE